MEIEIRAFEKSSKSHFLLSIINKWLYINMISKKWCVTVISIVALLAGCFSAERKKNVKENKISINKKPDKHEKNKSKNFSQPADNSFNQQQNFSYDYSFDKNNGLSLDEHNKNITTPANNMNFAVEHNAKHAGPSLFGEVKINFPLMGKRLSNPSLDFLLPLKNNENELFFTQMGIRRHEDRNIFNLGFGQRHFFDQWMFGYNTFYDTQSSGSSHQRLGLGMELWSDNVKFSANSYYRLSGWKVPHSGKMPKERVANGYDLTMEAYLPGYPQLGGKLKFENYFGSNVATSKNSKQNNPAAMTLGVNYSPVPLIMFGIDHSHWFDDRSEEKFNLAFNYQFSVPLSRQLDPHYVPFTKTLAGSRMNLVERNNTITLEHKDHDQDFVSLQLPGEITGYDKEIKDIQFHVSAKLGLDHIVWDTSSITPMGGKVIKLAANTYQIQLPQYNINGINQYTISAVAYDKKGHASNTSKIIVLTMPSQSLTLVKPVKLTDEVAFPSQKIEECKGFEAVEEFEDLDEVEQLEATIQSQPEPKSETQLGQPMNEMDAQDDADLNSHPGTSSLSQVAQNNPTKSVDDSSATPPPSVVTIHTDPEHVNAERINESIINSPFDPSSEKKDNEEQIDKPIPDAPMLPPPPIPFNNSIKKPAIIKKPQTKDPKESSTPISHDKPNFQDELTNALLRLKAKSRNIEDEGNTETKQSQLQNEADAQKDAILKSPPKTPCASQVSLQNTSESVVNPTPTTATIHSEDDQPKENPLGDANPPGKGNPPPPPPPPQSSSKPLHPNPAKKTLPNKQPDNLGSKEKPFLEISKPNLLIEAKEKLKKPASVLRQQSSIKDNALSHMRNTIEFDQKKSEEYRQSQASETDSSFDFDNEVPHQETTKTRHDSGIDSLPSSARNSVNSPLPTPETSPLIHTTKTDKPHNAVDPDDNTTSSYISTIEFKEELAKIRKDHGYLSDSSDSSDCSDNEE